jgi:hypothetical protein
MKQMLSSFFCLVEKEAGFPMMHNMAVKIGFLLLFLALKYGSIYLHRLDAGFVRTRTSTFISHIYEANAVWLLPCRKRSWIFYDTQYGHEIQFVTAFSHFEISPNLFVSSECELCFVALSVEQI